MTQRSCSSASPRRGATCLKGHLSRRLDLGLRVQQDDTFHYEAALASSLPPPPAPPDEAQGTPRAPKLAGDAPPGFEPPPNPPAFDLPLRWCD